MKSLFTRIFLPLLACACLLAACNEDQNPDRKAITLKEGCYVGPEDWSIIVFPAGQHGSTKDAPVLSMIYSSEYGTGASMPIFLTDFSDSLGTASFTYEDSSIQLIADGKSSITYIAQEDTFTFTLQPEVSYAPRSLQGEWAMTYALNQYISYKMAEATIDADLRASVQFIVPDEQMIELMMSGLLEGDIEELLGNLPAGINYSELLQALSTPIPGDVWYSSAAGAGIFVPETDSAQSFAVYFTTPNGSTIRIAFSEFNLDFLRQ